LLFNVLICLAVFLKEKRDRKHNESIPHLIEEEVVEV